jgi:hypothetical protein
VFWLQAFLQYYYQLFESNRAGLANLYQDGSMLTFEGQKFQGTQAIVGKLAQLPFNQCKVNPTSMDFQPSVAGGIMVFVTGSIVVRVLLVALLLCCQCHNCLSISSKELHVVHAYLDGLTDIHGCGHQQLCAANYSVDSLVLLLVWCCRLRARATH